MKAFPSRGLYAITKTDNESASQIIEAVAAAIKGGACVVQYREKNPIDAYAIAHELKGVCHQANVPLIINDDIELAYQVKADGVHLGKTDDNIAEARSRLGNKAIIGISCYNSVASALSAQNSGATYVAFGRFFPSTSKPLAAPAELDTLKQAKKTITLPIVAIGGILPQNGGQLLEAGADVLAVIGGIFAHDPEQSTKAFQGLFNN